MIWLALNFYQLPLDIFINARDESDAQKPLAIVEQGVIIHSNQAALDQGIDAGIKLASAYALSSQLVIKSRNKTAEKNSINQLAVIAYQFSSQVCLYSEQVILLEVEASCRLFDKLDQILKQLSQQLLDFSFHYHAALATSAAGAYLLSFYLQKDLKYWLQELDQQSQAKIIEQSQQHLKQLPIDFLSYEGSKVSSSLVTRIKKMGLKKLDDLFRLPSASLGRRLGMDFVIYLDQLKGQRSEVFVFFQPAEYFIMQLVFIDGIDSVEQILFAAKRLLNALLNFLNARRLMAAHLVWQLVDFRRCEQRFVIELSSEVQRILPLVNLTRLKLESLILKEKIEVVKLRVDIFHSLAEKQNTLLMDDNPMANQSVMDEAFNPLVDQLIARLGNKRCFSLQLQDHHLPEKHSRLLAFEPAQRRKRRTSSLSHYSDSQRLVVLNDLSPLQPLWLSRNIKPINHLQNKQSQWLNYQGRLIFLSGAEKLQDDWLPSPMGPVERDYYLCQNSQQNFYWIYYDHNKNHWFLQGIF